jgi:hypothetical protein
MGVEEDMVIRYWRGYKLAWVASVRSNEWDDEDYTQRS